MPQDNLRDVLVMMVREHGLDQVQRHLSEIEILEHQHRAVVQKPTNSDKATVEKSSRRNRSKPSATKYVAGMELSGEISTEMAELAARFDAKAFLPSFGDIRNFCDIYGLDVPGSKSRASAIPRVFKRLASMEVADIQRIIDQGHFSGPSRLGPISDAIRRNSRGTSAKTAARNRIT